MSAIIIALVIAAPAPQPKLVNLDNVEVKIIAISRIGVTGPLRLSFQHNGKTLYADLDNKSDVVHLGTKLESPSQVWAAAEQQDLFRYKVKITVVKSLVTKIASGIPPEFLHMPKVED